MRVDIYSSGTRPGQQQAAAHVSGPITRQRSREHDDLQDGGERQFAQGSHGDDRWTADQGRGHAGTAGWGRAEGASAGAWGHVEEASAGAWGRPAMGQEQAWEGDHDGSISSTQHRGRSPGHDVAVQASLRPSAAAHPVQRSAGQPVVSRDMHARRRSPAPPTPQPALSARDLRAKSPNKARSLGVDLKAPFVVGKPSAKSHNVGTNMQIVLAMLKDHGITLDDMSRMQSGSPRELLRLLAALDRELASLSTTFDDLATRAPPGFPTPAMKAIAEKMDAKMEQIAILRRLVPSTATHAPRTGPAFLHHIQSVQHALRQVTDA